MKNNIFYFILINVCFVIISCKNDAFKDTEILPVKPTYSGVSQTVEDITISFTNGTNEKYLMHFDVSGDDADTSVFRIISVNKNVAKIKHTTNGTRQLIVNYYAKGQLVSKDSVEISTTGSTIPNFSDNVFFLRNFIPHKCKSNGTSVLQISNYLNNINTACINNDVSSIIYPSGSYAYKYDIATSSNTYYYVGSVNKIYSNNLNQLCVDYESNSYVKIYNSNFSKLISTFYPSYTGIYILDKYVLNYTNSYTNEYACISYNYNSQYNYYVQYCINKVVYTIATSSYNSNSPNNFSQVRISPNSKYLSYIEFDGLYYNLKVYDLTTNLTYNVFKTTYSIDSYSFSSNDTKIILSSYSLNNSSFDLFVVNSTGGTAINISKTYNINETSVDWK